MATAFKHDVSWLHIAVHETLSVHGRQGVETIPDDGHRDTGFETRLFGAGCDQHIIDVIPAFFAKPLFDDSKHSRG